MARDHDRIGGDNAGVGPEPGIPSRLHRLSESHHYRIASGEPDIRGWEVRTLSGNHLGEVEDLLIDPHRGEVVMIDVDLDNSSERINVPIKGVQLDRNSKSVIVDSGDIRDAQDAVMHDRVHEDVRGRDVRDESSDARDVRYGAMRTSGVDEGTVEETVVERRPIVEEVVVRRRVVDDDSVA
ncbi:MAG TPA: PRC-barrel domain-containing protein [Longimicrobiales bacterium]